MHTHNRPAALFPDSALKYRASVAQLAPCLAEPFLIQLLMPSAQGPQLPHAWPFSDIPLRILSARGRLRAPRKFPKLARPWAALIGPLLLTRSTSARALPRGWRHARP